MSINGADTPQGDYDTMRARTQTLIREALSKPSWQDELRQLANRAYLEENLVPWVDGFRLFVSDRGAGACSAILSALCDLLADESVPLSMGALSLLDAMNRAAPGLAVHECIIDRVPKANPAVYPRLLPYIYMETSGEKRGQILKFMRESGPQYRELAEDLSSCPPIDRILEVVASGDVWAVDVADMMAHFLSQCSLKQILWSGDEFFRVFNSAKSEQELLHLVGALAIDHYRDPNVGLFVSVVLDSPLILEKFLPTVGSAFTDYIRPLAVATPGSTVKNWARKVVGRRKLDPEERYALAARGDLRNLSHEVRHTMANEYQRMASVEPNYDVLIPDYPSGDPEAVAAQVRESAGVNTLPIDLGRLAQAFGIAVIPIDASSDSRFDGCLFRAPDLAFPLIFFNSAVSSTGRQRFTVAHELAHYLLRHSAKTYTCVSDEWLAGSGRPQDEREADQLSAAILMSVRQVTIDARGGIGSWNRVAGLATKYSVSLTALVCRMLDFTNVDTALIRLRDGKVDLTRVSRRFGFWNGLIARGVPCPPNAAANRVLSGDKMSVEEQVPFGVWFDTRALGVSPERYQLTEYAVAASPDTVLVLLEIDDADDYTDEEPVRRFR